MLYRNKKGTVVGEMRGNKYRSWRRSSIHILKMLDAWGVDSAIIEQLGNDGCEEIRIFDQDTDMVYAVTYEKFIDNAIEKRFAGLQMFLPLKLWDVNERVHA